MLPRMFFLCYHVTLWECFTEGHSLIRYLKNITETSSEFIHLQKTFYLC